MTKQDKQQLFAAMELYLTNNAHDCGEFEQQVRSDLDLAGRCFQIAKNYSDESCPVEKLAEQVVFEVLNWYPESIRSKIAVYLSKNCRSD